MGYGDESKQVDDRMNGFICVPLCVLSKEKGIRARLAIFLHCERTECFFGGGDECRRRTEKRLMECAIDERKERAFVANTAIRLLCCFRAPSPGRRCPQNRVGPPKGCHQMKTDGFPGKCSTAEGLSLK